MTELSGGCRCGRVRLSVRGEPLRVGICHCIDCRQESGSAFTFYGVWPADRFRTSGDTSEFHGRRFCPGCGSRLFSVDAREAEIKLGSLSRAPTALVPSYELWVKRREPWLRPLDGAQQHEGDRPVTDDTPAHGEAVAPAADAALADADARHLRRAIALGAETGGRGNRPFGAVIVAASGEVLAEGVNDTATRGDCTGHAELNAIRDVSPRHGRELLAGATMYASGEPCVMCAGAIFWSNIRRVVFGLDAVSLRAFRASREGAADVVMSCRDVFAAAPHPIETTGPALADEAAAPHRAFWTP